MTAALTVQRARTTPAPSLARTNSSTVPTRISSAGNMFRRSEMAPGDTGIVGIPWGFTLSGTLNAAGGPAFGDVGSIGRHRVNGGGVHSAQGHPYKTSTFAGEDLQNAMGHEVTADFQVYNLFDGSIATIGVGLGRTGQARSRRQGEWHGRRCASSRRA